MPLPFLLLGAAALLGGTGVVAAVAGHDDRQRAENIARQAERRGHAANRTLEQAQAAAQADLARRAEAMQDVVRGPHARFLALVRALQERGMARELRCVDGVTVTPATLTRAASIHIAPAAVAGGLARGALAGAGAGAATWSLVSTVGMASTGTAIAGLSGAAAESAALACLGGGSIAAGGGGVALGTTVLGGIVAAPVLLVGGLAMASAGAEALTRATRHAAHIDRDIGRVEAAVTLLGAVRARVGELSSVATGLGEQLTRALIALNAGRFDARDARDARALAVATTLWSALDEVLHTPAFDASGQLTLASAQVVLRHRALAAGGVA